MGRDTASSAIRQGFPPTKRQVLEPDFVAQADSILCK
jgi:hypothetical protein